MSYLGSITEKEYNNIKALRNSELGLLEKSFAHYKRGSERTAAMIFGTAFHMYVLEENTFWENFIVAPKYDGRTTEGKKIKAQLDEQAQAGKEILKNEDFETIKAMRQSLFNHPKAKNIFTDSENEGAYTAEINGAPCKCKLDAQNKGIFFDLKSTDDASYNGFRKSIGKYRYDRQAAFYGDIAASNGIEFKGFVFVAVEKEFPYHVACWALDPSSIELGRQSYLKLIEKYKYHTENPQAFDGISDKIMEISAPNWLFMDSAVNGV